MSARLATLLVGAATIVCAAARAQEAQIVVHADQTVHRVSRYLTGACIEDVNHEIYGGLYSQMVFGESFQEPAPAAPPKDAPQGVSGMWRAVRRGTAVGQWSMPQDRPFVGKQFQRVAFSQGEGVIGVENRGLKRWGMAFVKDKPYEGVLWVRCEKPCEVYAVLESGDGVRSYAQQRLSVAAGDWQRLTFSLTPDANDTAGRFTVTLRKPGSVDLGYAFLQPGPWGRFKGLPVRRDVAEALVDQGITVLRYGGSMVNHAEYRWKKMIGPRDRRPPYTGTWYPHSTSGWGIVDFVDFCRAAGFLCIPAFNMGETPQDMADFVEYISGTATSTWGAKRAADGHPGPFRLRYLELGNEERVDEGYFQKFKPLAEAIWAKDPQLTLVVGDFVYSKPIRDPDNFTGAASRITSLAAQRKILELAKSHGREVWFDIHVGTDGPRPDSTFDGMFSFQEALGRIADGAQLKIAVFEFNAGNHAQRRALANALAIQAIERDGRIPVATSANCLQPDGQNDNGWDQGLLFLNPSQVWLQPPGYVTRMISRNYQPLLVKSEVQSPDNRLDVTAKRSEDGKTLVLQAVNSGDKPLKTAIRLDGLKASKAAATVEELSGPLDDVNTSDAPRRISPRPSEWKVPPAGGQGEFTFAPYSFTVIRLE